MGWATPRDEASMHARIVFALLTVLLVGTSGAAAQIIIPMSSFEQFLRVDPADVAQAPLVVTLESYGLAPGYTLRIQPVGGFDNGPGTDAPHAFMAVFSASSTVLASSLRYRVPGAIDAGEDYVTVPTCPGGHLTDIPEDFTVNVEGVDVVIPAGATHLMLCPRECYSNDNSDPNSDFAAQLTLVSTSTAAPPAASLSLRAPWPSPTTSGCTIAFTLPTASSVTLEIYGVDGRRVRTLLEWPLAAGAHEFAWDSRDGQGARVASGVYVARLASPLEVRTHRIVVVR